jgi:Putative beta-barrel porin-2, OmpL-like. bbp2
MRKKRSLFSFMAGLALFGVELSAQTPTPAPPVDAAAPSAQAAPTAQTPAGPAAAAAPAPVDPGILHQWGTDFSFMADGYIEGNFDSPSSGFNQLRAFDVRSDMPHLNMAMLTIDHAPAPIGFHLDVGFGEMFDIIHEGTRDPSAWNYFKQAYVSIKPKSWHGVELDAGEFVTSAGAEVIETNQNYNYTRSLLFTWAIPYSHTGFRLQFPIGPHFNGSFQVVNGWNNVEPINSGKTYGFTGAYAWKKVTWSNNYYVGPEHPGTTMNWRNLYDTSAVVTQTDKLSWYLNYDYGRDKSIGLNSSVGVWTGLAGAAHYAITKKYAVSGRLEFFDDRNGFATGTAQTLKEFTLTAEYQVSGWLMSRAEFRNDWSNQDFFEKNSNPHGAKSQPTALLGLIAYFAPKK